MTTYHAYMRELLNAKDSDVGYQIGMHVWALRDRPDEASEYLNRVLAAAKSTEDTAFKVAKKLKDLLPSGVSS